MANLAAPGLVPLRGSLTIGFDSELWGVVGNLIRAMNQGQAGGLEVLAGFHHLYLREGLSIREDLTVPANNAGVATGDFLVSDNFGAENRF